MDDEKVKISEIAVLNDRRSYFHSFLEVVKNANGVGFVSGVTAAFVMLPKQVSNSSFSITMCHITYRNLFVSGVYFAIGETARQTIYQMNTTRLDEFKICACSGGLTGIFFHTTKLLPASGKNGLFKAALRGLSFGVLSLTTHDFWLNRKANFRKRRLLKKQKQREELN